MACDCTATAGCGRPASHAASMPPAVVCVSCFRSSCTLWPSMPAALLGAHCIRGTKPRHISGQEVQADARHGSGSGTGPHAACSASAIKTRLGKGVTALLEEPLSSTNPMQGPGDGRQRECNAHAAMASAVAGRCTAPSGGPDRSPGLSLAVPIHSTDQKALRVPQVLGWLTPHSASAARTHIGGTKQGAVP